MALDLHPNAKARITEIVAGALPLIDVDHGKYISRASEGVLLIVMADRALPQRGPIHDALLAYVDDYPLVEFILDTLAIELQSAEYQKEPARKKLAELPGYENSAEVAARLISQFEALPNQYRITCPLPKALWGCLPDDKNQWTFETTSSRLVRTSKELSDLLPLKVQDDKEKAQLFGGGLLSSLLTGPLTWEENAVHIQMDIEGFIGPYGGSVPDLEARRFIRSVCGLGLALRLFQINSNYPLYPPKYGYFVHRKNNEENWRAERKLELDDRISWGLEKLEMGDLVNTPEKHAHWCPRILEEMAHVIAAGKRAEPIMLASQWYFDSATGSDPLLPFIQAMVVLEILLGDKAASKEIGLNELLRNRCAYLIGSSQEEREDLYKTFSDIYDVRSQIVHRGKHRLNAHERTLLSRLRSMCRRVIQKEVDLLRADKKKDVPAQASQQRVGR
ncbi:HEPN domain-containing protein [Bradyrhizobium cenepequi]|uniref:HEPN domain-containing protein n=1 Tax=Bradyrhizobium cenepequi TaxID=2821403 RepID=UPI001CE23997|nr:HEPN domain-containing protein [Bradyrhizobium cenepequi]MCA6112043.1 hypothetical protein [Bradyrhizobium cenepequi]